MPDPEETTNNSYGMQLERLRGDIGIRLGVIDTRLEAALVGVSNFREFQKEAREFFTAFKTEKSTREADLDRQARAVRDALVLHDAERAKTLASENVKKENRRKFWNTFIAAGLLFFAGLSWYDHYTSEKSRDAIMQAVKQAPAGQTLTIR